MLVKQKEVTIDMLNNHYEEFESLCINGQEELLCTEIGMLLLVYGELKSPSDKEKFRIGLTDKIQFKNIKEYCIGKICQTI